MVNIIYQRNLNRVSIDGHAQCGEAGQDLVCASVSILAYTLASFVENMKIEGQTKHRVIELKEGRTLISCNALKRYKSSVTLVFDSICAGFELLAHDYPDNVLYKIIA